MIFEREFASANYSISDTFIAYCISCICKLWWLNTMQLNVYSFQKPKGSFFISLFLFHGTPAHSGKMYSSTASYNSTLIVII